MYPTNERSGENEGVYELITSLCQKTAAKYYNQSNKSQKLGAAKMRSLAYEIILKKSCTNVEARNVSPFIDLLSYSFMLHNSARNAVEYKKSSELKDLIDIMKETDFGEKKEHIHNILKLLNGLCDTDKQDITHELYQVFFVIFFLKFVIDN